MMKSLIPLLVLVSGVAGAVDIQKRVYGGDNCDNNQGQHYVVLTVKKDNLDTRYCGGNLIGPDWVLTAGHCDLGKFDVILGKHSTGHEKKFSITPKEVRHFYGDKRCHDIMLINLPAPAPKELHSTIIKMPDVGCSSPTTTATAANDEYIIMGWSNTKYDAATKKYHELANVLQCGEVKLDATCSGRDQEVKYGQREYKQHLLCSIQPDACTGCPGDSGGSLVGKDGLLYGVTVAGSNPTKGRTRYMDVCAYRDWIESVTGI